MKFSILNSLAFVAIATCAPSPKASVPGIGLNLYSDSSVSRPI